MKTDNDKQHEWEALAASEQDSGKQLLRPFEQGQWQLLASDISQKLELQDQSLSLLDVGCGNAYLVSLFESLVSSITGIDYAPSMISEAKKRLPHSHFEVSSADKLRFSDEMFDRSLSYSIFHYFLSDQQIFDAIDELCRVTKKGGIILIGDLLDKRFEHEIKSKSDVAIEVNLPKIKRYSEWRFVDLDAVVDFLRNKTNRVEILVQNEAFATSSYRKDIKIWV